VDSLHDNLVDSPQVSPLCALVDNPVDSQQIAQPVNLPFQLVNPQGSHRYSLLGSHRVNQQDSQLLIRRVPLINPLPSPAVSRVVNLLINRTVRQLSSLLHNHLDSQHSDRQVPPVSLLVSPPGSHRGNHPRSHPDNHRVNHPDNQLLCRHYTVED
jgi:hypothetical protein